MTVNTLYYGDNLAILREHIPDELVDLIYLDPPFNSNASYNVLFKERSGEGYIRLSMTLPDDKLEEGVRRMSAWKGLRK